MVLDSITSPHRRTQTPFTSNSVKKTFPPREELGNCTTLFQRHRFLLTMLALLGFLCTVYLYFAVTLGASGEMCSESTGTEKVLCRLAQAKASAAIGKLKFF